MIEQRKRISEPLVTRMTQYQLWSSRSRQQSTEHKSTKQGPKSLKRRYRCIVHIYGASIYSYYRSILSHLSIGAILNAATYKLSMRYLTSTKQPLPTNFNPTPIKRITPIRVNGRIPDDSALLWWVMRTGIF